MVMIFLWLPALLVAGLPGAQAAGPDSVGSLIEAERAFSRRSVEHGMRDAFLAYLAPGAVVFNPLPTPGRPLWDSRSPSPSTLIWEPAFAEISASGDLGYTTGPWELRPAAEAKDRPVVHGQFISVWRRNAGGVWKVEADIGITHDRPGGGLGGGEPALHRQAGTPRKSAPAMAREEILTAERTFARVSRLRGLAASLPSWITPDARVCRDGHRPVLGRDAARAALATDTLRAEAEVQEAGTSLAGDLGYTYGIRRRLRPAPNPPDSSVFFHVWRRDVDGQWLVALAVDNPIRR